MTDKKGYGDIFVNTTNVIFNSALLNPYLKLLLPLELSVWENLFAAIGCEEQTIAGLSI